MGRNEVRGAQRGSHITSQQLFEVRRGQRERLNLRNASTCLQRRLYTDRVVSLRGDSRETKRERENTPIPRRSACFARSRLLRSQCQR